MMLAFSRAKSKSGTSFSKTNSVRSGRAAWHDSALTNDYFTQRTALSGVSFNVTGSNLVMTKEPGEPLHGGSSGGKSAWWQWDAPQSGTVTLHTNGSNFDTTLGVYTGSSVAALTFVTGDDDSGDGLNSLVTFQAAAGGSTMETPAGGVSEAPKGASA